MTELGGDEELRIQLHSMRGGHEVRLSDLEAIEASDAVRVSFARLVDSAAQGQPVDSSINWGAQEEVYRAVWPYWQRLAAQEQQRRLEMERHPLGKLELRRAELLNARRRFASVENEAERSDMKKVVEVTQRDFINQAKDVLSGEHGTPLITGTAFDPIELKEVELDRTRASNLSAWSGGEASDNEGFNVVVPPGKYSPSHGVIQLRFYPDGHPTPVLLSLDQDPESDNYTPYSIEFEEAA